MSCRRSRRPAARGIFTRAGDLEGQVGLRLDRRRHRRLAAARRQAARGVVERQRRHLAGRRRQSALRRRERRGERLRADERPAVATLPSGPVHWQSPIVTDGLVVMPRGTRTTTPQPACSTSTDCLRAHPEADQRADGVDAHVDRRAVPSAHEGLVELVRARVGDGEREAERIRPARAHESAARIAYSVMCAHLRSTRSQPPRPELSDGTARTRRSRPSRRRPGASGRPTRSHGRFSWSHGRTVREPGEIRDGPAAVRGVASSQRCHWRKPGRRRKGSLESEDLPVALHTEPLAEGGFVAKRLVLVLSFSLSCLPPLRSDRQVRVEGKTQTLFAPDRDHRHRVERAGCDSSRRRSSASSTTTSPFELRPVRRPGRPLRRQPRRAAGCSR